MAVPGPTTSADNQHATAAARNDDLAGSDLDEARAAVAALGALPAHRPGPTSPAGPAGTRPAITRSAQATRGPQR